LVLVKQLTQRQRFLKQNPDFLSLGSLRRGTASHLYMQENLPKDFEDVSAQAQRKYEGPFGKIQLGNDMWSKLPEDEKEEYTQRAKDMKIADLRGRK